MISKSFRTTVSDNQLNIYFVASVDNPIINAIAILPSGGLIGDTNGDNKVNLADLVIFIANFGKLSGFEPTSDVNTDGRVNLFDIVMANGF